MSDFINTVESMGDDALTTAILNRTVTEFCDDSQEVIGDGAFFDCAQLTKVQTPNIRELGESCFAGCVLLESANLPSGMEKVKNRQFQNCTKLRLSSIPNGVTEIGDFAFEGCCFLYWKQLPQGLVSIGVGAFKGCTGIQLEELPVKVTVLETDTFRGCTLLSIPSLPNTITAIGARCFAGCSVLPLTALPTALTAIEGETFKDCVALALTSLPATVLSIGARAFEGCTKVTMNSLPANLTTLGERAFKNCDLLRLNSMSKGITEIKDETFYQCGRLNTEKMPTSLVRIGARAFTDCTDFDRLVFPSVTSYVGEDSFKGCTSLFTADFGGSPTLESGAFADCTVLSTLVLRGDTVSDLKSADALSGTRIANGQGYIYVPKSLLNSYKMHSEWYQYENQFRAVEDYPYETGESGYFEKVDGRYQQLNTWQELLDNGVVTIGANNALSPGGQWETFRNNKGIFVVDESVKNLSFAMFSYAYFQRVRICASMFIPQTSMRGANALNVIDWGRATSVNGDAIAYSQKIESIIIRSKAVPALSHTFAAGKSGIFYYVPKRLVASYKTADNWKNYAGYFRAIEDYPDLCLF